MHCFSGLDFFGEHVYLIIFLTFSSHWSLELPVFFFMFGPQCLYGVTLVCLAFTYLHNHESSQNNTFSHGRMQRKHTNIQWVCRCKRESKRSSDKTSN